MPSLLSWLGFIRDQYRQRLPLDGWAGCVLPLYVPLTLLFAHEFLLTVITVAAGIQVGNTVVSSYIIDSYPLQSTSVVIFYAVFLNLSAFVNPVLFSSFLYFFFYVYIYIYLLHLVELD